MDKTLPRHLVEEGFMMVRRDVPAEYRPYHLVIQVARKRLLVMQKEMLQYFEELGVKCGKALLAFEYDRDRFKQPIYSKIHLHCLLFTTEDIVQKVEKGNSVHWKGLYDIGLGYDLEGLKQYLEKQIEEVRDLPPMILRRFELPQTEPMIQRQSELKPHSAFDNCNPNTTETARPGGDDSKEPEVESPSWGHRPSFLPDVRSFIQGIIDVILKGKITLALQSLFQRIRDS